MFKINIKNAKFSDLKFKKAHLGCNSKQVKEVTGAHSKYWEEFKAKRDNSMGERHAV